MPEINQVFHVEAFLALGIANIVAPLRDAITAAPEWKLRKDIVLIADKTSKLVHYGHYDAHWQQPFADIEAMRFRILYDDNEPTSADLQSCANKTFPALLDMAEAIMRTGLELGMEESDISLHTPEEVENLVRQYFDAHLPG